MSSWSIFDQDINADGYLSSLVPLEHYLTIESHAKLKEIYMVLFKSVHDICVKLATNETIFGIDKNQSSEGQNVDLAKYIVLSTRYEYSI